MGQSAYLLGQKRQELEYLQFLWGIRHLPPDKINQIDVEWIIIVRSIFILLMMLLSLTLYPLGRHQPLSFIIAIMLLRVRETVILRTEKFLLSWLAIAAFFLDVIWIAFGARQASQINYLDSSMAEITTYGHLGVMAVFLIFMIMVEKAFSKEEIEA